MVLSGRHIMAVFETPSISKRIAFSMAKSTVVPFELPLEFSPDPLTEVIILVLGRRPINGDVIQDVNSGRFHIVEFLAHGRTVQQNQSLAAEQAARRCACG